MARLIERVREVAFDLDGTLVDTAPDLATAANAMLEALGRAPLSEDLIRLHIGHGVERLVESVLEECGGAPSAGGLEVAGELFRQHYSRRLFARSRVYPGVSECLRALREMGLPLACVTNKHSRFAIPLLDGLKLGGFFGFTLCGDRAEHRKPRPDLLQAACARAGVAPNEMLYVGDSRTDIQAARAAGCAIAVVDYGYNNQGVPLSAEGADAIVASLIEILALPDERRLAPAAA